MNTNKTRTGGCRGAILILTMIAALAPFIQAQSLDTLDCSKTWYTVRLDSTYNPLTKAYRTDSVFYNDLRYGAKNFPSYNLQIRAVSAPYNYNDSTLIGTCDTTITHDTTIVETDTTITHDTTIVCDTTYRSARGIDTLRMVQAFTVMRMLGKAPVLDTVWLPVRIMNEVTGVADTIIIVNRIVRTFQGTSVRTATFTPVEPLSDGRMWRIEWVNGIGGWRDDHLIYLEYQHRKWTE